MKSLADILGIEDPRDPGRVSEPSPEPSKLTAKQLSREMLNSRQYRDSLMRRIVMDELPPAVECKLWDYAYGRPVEKVEIKDTTEPLEALSTSQLKDRAQFLMDIAEKMEADKVEEDAPVPGVH